MLVEYRTLHKISKTMWFKTEETTRKDETYSCVYIADENGNYLFEDGCNVLVIGCNPRGGDYDKEIADYQEAQKTNPGLKHRKVVDGRALQDALEPFRRTPIYKIERVKKLIAWDMFAYRTSLAGELVEVMKSFTDDVDFKQKICGEHNLEKLITLLKTENFDYIVFSWGNCWNGIKDKKVKDFVNGYLAKIKSAIETIPSYQEKCYCYGIAKNFPRHQQARGFKNFRKVSPCEFDIIFKPF